MPKKKAVPTEELEPMEEQILPEETAQTVSSDPEITPPEEFLFEAAIPIPDSPALEEMSEGAKAEGPTGEIEASFSPEEFPDGLTVVPDEAVSVEAETASFVSVEAAPSMEPPSVGDSILDDALTIPHIEPAIPVPQEPPKSDRELFYALRFNELDRDLTPEERQEWNSIYASYRSRSAITGTIIGVDPFSISVRNPETQEMERQTMYCAVIVPYRVRIVIPATEMWESGH